MKKIFIFLCALAVPGDIPKFADVMASVHAVVHRTEDKTGEYWMLLNIEKKR
jgi:hypothetical protein